jgi:hypothetical protein
VATRRAAAALWAAVVLLVGLATVHSVSTNSATTLGVALGVTGGAVVLTLFASNVNALYFVAFASLAMPTLVVPGVRLPVSEIILAVALIVAVVQNRRERERLRSFPKIMAAAIIAAMTTSAAMNNSLGIDSLKRISHLVIFCGIFLAIGAGYFPRRVIQKGMLTGLGLASAFGLVYLVAGLNTGYGGRLTGLLFGDPNRAALAILTLGFLSIDVVPRGARRNLVFAFLGTTFLLTQSRGSLVAASLCLVWWIFARRLRPTTGLAFIGGAAAAISAIPSATQDSGVFETRTGSDMLRSAIFEESTRSAIRGFWFGNGPGTAKVEIRDTFTFYFHNSYLAVISEGGIFTALAIFALMFIEFIRLSFLPAVLRNTWIEMAIIATVTASFHLGEALLELPSAVAIGFCIDWIARPEAGHSLAAPRLRHRKVPTVIGSQIPSGSPAR